MIKSLLFKIKLTLLWVFFVCLFLIEVKVHNIIKISGVQHSDSQFFFLLSPCGLKSRTWLNPAHAMCGMEPVPPAVETKSLNQWTISSVQFNSVVQLCPTLCDPMDCSTPSYPVHHQLPELAQTQVHRVGDVIQPPHPLLSPSPPAFNLSQRRGLFWWLTIHIRWPKY